MEVEEDEGMIVMAKVGFMVVLFIVWCHVEIFFVMMVVVVMALKMKVGRWSW